MWSLVWVPGRWLPVWYSVDQDGVPAHFRGVIVVVAAGYCEVVEVGFAAFCPVGGVVELGLGCGAGAAGKGAATIPSEGGFA